MDAEVNWNQYFEGIQTQCPWSWSAWRKGKINLTEWRGDAWPLGSWSARVYICNLTPRQLQLLHDDLNDEWEEYEFLWSHPSYSGHSTPQPCIIQQDAVELEHIRAHLSSAFIKL